MGRVETAGRHLEEDRLRDRRKSIRGLKVLVVDNYDSFTFNLVQLLGTLGACPEVVLSDAITPNQARSRAPAGIVLSPGPGAPDKAGATLGIATQLAGHVPLLGVCLGHQALAKAFGAKIRRAHRPLHGQVVAMVHNGLGLFGGLPQGFLAARYNSLAVDESTLPACLRIDARDPDGEVMALRHEHLAVWGVQFHPESVLSECGAQLLVNWLEALLPRSP